MPLGANRTSGGAWATEPKLRLPVASPEEQSRVSPRCSYSSYARTCTSFSSKRVYWLVLREVGKRNPIHDPVAQRPSGHVFRFLRLSVACITAR